MAWMKLYDSLLSHRKLKRLKRGLSCPDIVTVRGHLITLWLTVLGQSPDGVMQGWGDDEIADAAGYDGDPSVFVTALEKAHLIDRNPEYNCWSLHNWMERGGSHRERTRKAEWRKKRRGKG